MTLGFDTLKATKAFRGAGFKEDQAEALAVAVRDAVTDNVAGKADLEKMETSLRAEIGTVKVDMEKMEANIRADMSERFEKLHNQLWIIGIGAIGAIVALVKLL